MKRWETRQKLKVQNENLIDLLLENRGIKTEKEREEFLQPKLEAITPKSVGIDLKQLKKALTRIQKAIKTKEQVIVFGDYDVDGITGSAILWETLHSLGADVLPYIPHRMEEGYGLSTIGIQNAKLKVQSLKLIITVDNGIVASEAVDFAKKNNIDVIITDHHTVGEKLPDAHAIVHTTKLCGAGVAYLLSKELNPENDEDTHLELATLGTVADLVPLTGANRAIVKAGLATLSKTKRLGLQELYKQARIQKDGFSPYEIGFIIGPRLNASGRIESAMDSLRLLCTTNRARAEELAAKLELVNKERQQLLKEAKEHAITEVRSRKSEVGSLLFVAHESYPQGVIGLVAGKLVEEFYRPAIVVAIADKQSKASVRSISGFNIIEFLRMHSDFFVNVGGHPMAAGFTVATEKIDDLKKTLEEKANELLTEEVLTRSLKIDCEVDFSLLTKDLYTAIQTLAPFGMGNPEPVFATKNVVIDDIRIMGKDGSHLKLVLRQAISDKQQEKNFEAVGFGMGGLAADLHVGDKINVAYTLDENSWNGNIKLQLKLKDIVNKAKAV